MPMPIRLALLVVVLLLTPGVATAAPRAECDPRNTRPETCKAIWDGIGLPKSNATSGKIAICHDRYIVSHDNASKTPDWVVELLTKGKLTNKFKRPKVGFSPDLCVPKEFSAAAGDYAGTADKFEIGHMAPSEDFNNSDVNMRDTFIFSNAIPQAGDTFNAAIWRSLESEVRKAAIARKKLYVITGPIRGDGVTRKISIAKADNACGGAIELETFKTRSICKAVNTGQASECGNGVVVPVAVYKIAYDPDKNVAFGFVMANRNYKTGLGRPFIQESRVNVGVIEKLTGLKFFDALPEADRAALVNRCEHTTLWLPPKPKAKAKKKRKPA
jgi:DNA/RNA endonuclease G (NUC1)